MAEHICLKSEVINDMKKDIDNLYANRDVVVRLETLVNILVDQTKKQDEIMKQQSETMQKISNTVQQLSDTVEQQGVLLTQLAARQEDMLKKGSVEYMSIFQMILFKALPPLVLGGITYWVLNLVNR